MMHRVFVSVFATVSILLSSGAASAADGDPARGQRVFGACAACHALQPDRHMTGPSLAGIWHRKAGSLESFTRYSSALKDSGVTWDDPTLDEWIRDPQHLIPGNTMTFPGVKDPQQRADLLAFLKPAAQAGGAPLSARPRMGGMMGGGAVPNLKQLTPPQSVQSVTYCRDTYRVTTADGNTRAFWERNLRFKTDGGDDGPQKGAPALVRAGMMGDRADVIFAEPQEISALIAQKC